MWRCFRFWRGWFLFIAALACFMWETVLATDLLNFNVLEMDRKMRHEPEAHKCSVRMDQKKGGS